MQRLARNLNGGLFQTKRGRTVVFHKAERPVLRESMTVVPGPGMVANARKYNAVSRDFFLDHSHDEDPDVESVRCPSSVRYKVMLNHSAICFVPVL